MVLFVIVLLGALSYLLCSISINDKEEDKWTGEDVGESLVHHDDEGVPHQSTKPNLHGQNTKKRKYTKRAPSKRKKK
jgi:hypothetical protein